MVGKAKTVDLNMTVADAFSRKKSDTYGAGNLNYGDKNNPCVIISSAPAMSADELLNYSYVLADNANPNDIKSCKRASLAIHSAADLSKNIMVTDKAENLEQWGNVVHQQQYPIILLVIAFMFILVFAVSLLTRIKLKTNLHSYALLRSVGIEESRLQKMLTKDTMHSTAVGIIIGIVPTVILIAILTVHYRYISLLSVIFTIVLPIAAGGIILLLLFTYLTSRITVKKMFKMSIVQSLDVAVY
jgi:ABC-type antimicrobial peptide transport system permease subunit